MEWLVCLVAIGREVIKQRSILNTGFNIDHLLLLLTKLNQLQISGVYLHCERIKRTSIYSPVVELGVRYCATAYGTDVS